MSVYFLPSTGFGAINVGMKCPPMHFVDNYSDVRERYSSDNISCSPRI